MNDADPAAPRRWSEGRVVFWFVLFVAFVLLYGPAYLDAFRPPDNRVGDFHQEWLSARSFAEGGPVYADQREMARRIWNAPPELAAELLPWNAHPPVAVVFALPCGRFSYSQAQLAWNLANVPFLILSIVVLVRELRIPFAPASALPLGVMLLGWSSLYSQVQHGQFNILLMALVTSAWAFDRRRRPICAGVAVGTAAALKLFPAFLVLYFLATKNVRAIAACALAFLAWNGLALGIVGFAEFETYFRDVLPCVVSYQSSRQNVSLAGFWLRLFDPHPNEHVLPLVASPILAVVCSYGSRLLAIAVIGRVAMRSSSRDARDRAFSLATFGMLLVSPIAWPHYFLLLALPLAWLWMNLAGRPARVAFWFAFAILWLPNYYVPSLVLGKEAGATFVLAGKVDVTPGQNLALASLPHYALLALTALAWRGRTSPPATDSVPPRPET